MTRLVSVVGMGAGDAGTLTLAGLRALEQADVVVGSARMLAALPASCAAARRVEAVAPSQIERALAQGGPWERAVVAVSGDVGLFSGARGLPARLERALPGCEARLVPGVSSAQLLAARLRVPWQDWRFASAHGVGCDACALAATGAPAFLVTGGATRAQDLCARLAAAGMGAVRVAVGERLGYPDERVVRGTAAELAREEFCDLAVLLLNAPGPDAAPASAPATGAPAWPYATPGIPDDAFERADVPMTKQEVRAVALAKLRVAPADVVYDVGAGTGSVSVELALLARRGHVYAVERRPEAVALVRANAARFGAGNLTVVEGLAPQALEGLPPCAAAFIGGTAGRLAQVLDALRAANPRVRVACACVTLETLSQATSLLAGPGWEGFEACQVSVARTRVAAGYHMVGALNPVFVASAQGSGADVPSAGEGKGL